MPFHSFKPKERSGKHVQAAKRGSLHSLWRRISAPFLIPQSICSHEWQPYDADLAGCVLCGAGHECRDGNCQTEQNEEGFPVCTITGCCVRTVSYSELEYLDSLAVDRRPVRTQRAGPVGEEEGGPHPVCSWDTRRPGDGHFKAGRWLLRPPAAAPSMAMGCQAPC